MNVLHIATKDTGGAAIGSFRIHESLNFNNEDVNSKLLCLWQNKSNHPKNINSYFTKKNTIITKYEKYQAYLNRKIYPKLKFNKNSIYSFYFSSPYHPESHELIQWADIIHLHWVNGFVNPFRFMKKVNKPIVWSFHDMTPFSGGNPYESGIFKNQLHKFERLLKKKQELMNRHGSVFGHATSLGFKQKAVNEYKTFSDNKVKVIPLPLSPELFNRLPKEYARKKLRITSFKPIVLFIAADVNNSRKGLQYLLDIAFFEKYTLLVAGSINTEFIRFPEIVQLGILDNIKLNLAYSAADLFISPSIEEAFGQTTIESLYCGTPVVAFPTSGSKQIINNGLNGFVTNDFTQNDLFLTIDKALNHPFNSDYISSDAKAIYHPQIIAKQLSNFYKTILKIDGH